MDEILEIIYNIYTIYSITCKDVEVPGIYVGSTSDFADRKKGHTDDSQDATKNQKKLYRIINENGGISNWKFKFLQVLTCTETEARIIERDWYDFLKADLNTIRPYITDEERKVCKAVCSKRFYYKNQEDMAEKRKQFYYKNKEIF